MELCIASILRPQLIESGDVVKPGHQNSASTDLVGI